MTGSFFPTKGWPEYLVQKVKPQIMQGSLPPFFVGILPLFGFFSRSLAIFMHFPCVFFVYLLFVVCQSDWTHWKGGTVLVQNIAFRYSLVFGIKFFQILFPSFYPTVLGFAHRQGMMLQALSYRVLKVFTFVYSTILACLAFLLLIFHQ